MDKNVLLIFLVLAAVVFGVQFYMRKNAPAAEQKPAQTAQQNAPAQPAPAPSAQPATVNAGGKTNASTKAAPQGAAAVQASAESEIVVENDVYRITFSNRGAQVKSWVLKKFDDEHGKPLDLVNAADSAKYGYPLSLWTYDENLRGQLNSALYVPNTTAKTLNIPGTLTFDYSNSGLTVRKTFHFDSSYVVGVDTSVFQNGSPVSAYPAWPAALGDQTNVPAYASGQFEYQNNDNTERVSYKKVSGGKTLQGNYNWAGVGSQYFAAAFIPDNPGNATVVTLSNTVETHASVKSTEVKTADALGIAVGRPGQSSERLFAGPKSLQVAESISVPSIVGAPKDLRTMVNFGSLGLIARPLFVWLRWTNQYVHNWGWSIVLQTLIITLALSPLRLMQMKSALKMQKVQPQMKAIQEKYKKYSMRDPRRQEMNKEVGELYKQHGVNPIGGCLPLLATLPFFWAYYRMLGAAIELRHASWLWIHDLSSPEPFPYFLPILMVASMFIMQRMTPQAGMDPAQQRMMNIMMPAFMGFLFFNLAAGLNLYYAESNLLSIGQQWLMNRTELGREMREIAAKRARKKQT